MWKSRTPSFSFTLVFLLWALPVRAAYVCSGATVASSEVLGNGQLHIVVTLVGDSGEPPVNHEFFSVSLADLQTQCVTVTATLNNAVTALATLPAGTVLDLVAPPPLKPTPPTQAQQAAAVALQQYQQAWALVSALTALENFGVGGAVAGDLAEALALLQAAYTPQLAVGYLGTLPSGFTPTIAVTPPGTTAQ